MRLLALLLIALGLTVAFDGDRVRCCHGCDSYYCNALNCGDRCGMGPRCQGCWKTCHRAADAK